MLFVHAVHVEILAVAVYGDVGPGVPGDENPSILQPGDDRWWNTAGVAVQSQRFRPYQVIGYAEFTGLVADDGGRWVSYRWFTYKKTTTTTFNNPTSAGHVK